MAVEIDSPPSGLADHGRHNLRPTKGDDDDGVLRQPLYSYVLLDSVQPSVYGIEVSSGVTGHIVP